MKGLISFYSVDNEKFGSFNVVDVMPYLNKVFVNCESKGVYIDQEQHLMDLEECGHTEITNDDGTQMLIDVFED